MTRLRYWNTRFVRYPLLAVVSMASLIVTGLNCGLSKSDWAAWVQAVGSIAAICAAIYVLHKQNEHSHVLQKVADKRTLSRSLASIDALAIRATDDVIFMAKEMLGELMAELAAQHPGILTTMPEERDFIRMGIAQRAGLPQFEDVLEAIKSIPTHEFGSKNLVQTMLDLRRMLEKVDADLKKAWDAGEDSLNTDSFGNGMRYWKMLAMQIQERALEETQRMLDA